MSEVESNVPKKIYLVWTEGSEGDSGYFNQYDSIGDAIDDRGDGTFVYEAEPKLLGQFEKKIEFVKLNSQKNSAKVKKK